MNIEVKTITKKLTKSLVNQMCVAGIKQMLTVLEKPDERIFGYLVNVRKGCHKTILVHDGGDYYVVPVEAWQKSEYDESLSIGDTIKNFRDEQARNRWFDAYSEIVRIGLDNHIYL